MKTNLEAVTILYAEDDEEDRMLTKAALQRSCLGNRIDFVEDGEELMDYLLHKGQYTDPGASPRPGLILLDLNMPRMDGREALKAIKAHDALKSIPVIVLTTSKAEEDIMRSYNIGANSYCTKPVTFEKLTELIKTLGSYWFQLVQLPVHM